MQVKPASPQSVNIGITPPAEGDEEQFDSDVTLGMYHSPAERDEVYTAYTTPFS
ncbi:MAG: hypothetical protein LBK59_05265 [Bifidobacteriaceae bacterium]|nr:hypothetical protein [Bifidobacteriaceae bacterium]